MIATSTLSLPGRYVEVEDLCCPGCHDAIRPAAAAAGGGVEFGHRDGTPLCRDGRGRVCEPIETTR